VCQCGPNVCQDVSKCVTTERSLMPSFWKIISRRLRQ